MNTRADSVMVAHPLFHAEGGGSIPTSALDLHFYVCDEDIFRRCNRQWHSRLPNVGNIHFRICYAAEYDNIVYAVAAWSNPVARLLPQHEWMELRRLAITQAAPKNTASRMIGYMTRDIRKRFPDIVRLISYQDCDYHKGTIYRASGWKQAENYISRPRKWAQGTDYHNTERPGRTNQCLAKRMRWEYAL